MARCPKCQAFMPDGVPFCSQCGCPLTSESAASSMGMPPAGPGMPPPMGQNPPFYPNGMPGPYPPGYGAPQVPDYLVWAILETLLCCLPLGIVAIVYASQANSAKAIGNYAEAIQKSQTAKTCIIWGVVGSVIVIGLYILLLVVGAAGSL